MLQVQYDKTKEHGFNNEMFNKFIGGADESPEEIDLDTLKETTEATGLGETSENEDVGDIDEQDDDFDDTLSNDGEISDLDSILSENEDDEEGDENKDKEMETEQTQNKVNVSNDNTLDDMSDSDTEIDADLESTFSFKKFNPRKLEAQFEESHHTTVFHNIQEVSELSKVYRNSNNIVIDELHKTVPFLTKYERARILGMRIKQLNNGCDAFVEIKDNIIDTSIIANKELEEKKLPFIIRRPIPGGGFEYWRLQDLELVHF